MGETVRSRNTAWDTDQAGSTQEQVDDMYEYFDASAPTKPRN